MREEVDAILDVVCQLTHPIPPLRHLGVKILHVREPLQECVHATEIALKENYLPMDLLKQLVLTTHKGCELREEGVHHSRRSAH